MISSPTPVSSGEADLNRTTSRRRGLSYLRALSHNRTSGPAGTSPNEHPRSPRHYFHRSLSHNEERVDAASPTTRRRSASRPNEPTSPLATDPRYTPSSQGHTRPSTPPTAVPPTTPRATGPADSTILGGSEQENSEDMARRRNTGSGRHANGTQQTDTTPAERADAAARPANPRAVSKTTSQTKGDTQDGEPKQQSPTLRLFPHQEMRNGRPSLSFAPISRTLPGENSIIRVGRYSEREGVPAANPIGPSDAPVGFKSKVVSRKHCEFSFVDGQWQIRDVASSSGTFLNHIRLSQPNTESKLFPVKDGDIVQLGIDFRGGEEMIFRCVKIRIECNRAWQKKPNNFKSVRPVSDQNRADKYYSKSRHQQLQSLAKDQPSADANSGECSICLGSVLPCQALFVAPCAHVWHYKCIRPMLEGKNSTYPQFQCPNCRAYSDLAADVDVAQSDMEEWMDNIDEQEDEALDVNVDNTVGIDVAVDTEMTDPVIGEAEADPEPIPVHRTDDPTITVSENPSASSSNPIEIPKDSNVSTASLRSSALLARRQAANMVSPELTAMNGNIDMPDRPDEDDMHVQLDHQRTRTQTPDPEQILAGEGPLTPRNNAGPFVFDGSAGRADARQLLGGGNAEATDEQVPVSL